jgi:hypothetical protein
VRHDGTFDVESLRSAIMPHLEGGSRT